MKRFLKLIILCLLVILLISPIVEVGKVEIVGANSRYVKQLTELVTHKNWLFTSSNRFATLLEKHHHVKKAVVKKNGLLSLQVIIEERKPFASVHSGGLYVMIDENGLVLELSEKSLAPYAIEGFHVQSAKIGYPIVTNNTELIEKAVQLVFLYQQNSDITPNVYLDDGQLIQKIGPQFWVNYGKGYDVEAQFNEAMAIYLDLKGKNSSTGIINLSIEGQTVIQSWKD